MQNETHPIAASTATAPSAPSAARAEAGENADSGTPDLRGMRLAYFCHRFPYFTETFVAREIRWLREFGADVQIFSLLPPKHESVHAWSRELLPYVHYAPFLSAPIVWANLRRLTAHPLRYLRAFWGVLSQTWPDAKAMLAAVATFPKTVYFAEQIEQRGLRHIHAHFVWLGGVAASVAATLLDITHSTMPHAFGLFSRPRGAVARQLRRADRIVTISDYHRRFIAELHPQLKYDDVEVIHCGIETDRFSPAATSRETSSCVLLSVGRLIEKKGHHLLIEAAGTLAREGHDFQCLVIGEGPAKQRYQARVRELGVEDRVKFLGAQTQEAIIDYYRQSDVFVLPCITARDGDRDGIPIALMEAMACELPVVTTALSGIPELVQHDVEGLLVPEGDAAALADALRQLMTDRARCDRLGAAARQKVLADFDARRNVSQIGQMFQRLAPPGESGAGSRNGKEEAKS